MSRLARLMVDPESGVVLASGEGSPSGLDLPRGSLFLRRDGAGGTTVYEKFGAATTDWGVLGGGVTTSTLVLTWDGGGSVLSAGASLDVRVPWEFTITKATLLSIDPADGTALVASAVVDLWVDSFANFPPTVADSITASAKPTLSSASKSEDGTLSDWSPVLPAGSCLIGHLDSVTDAKHLTLLLDGTRA